MTNKPLSKEDLNPALAIKNQLEIIKHSLSKDKMKINPRIPAINNKTFELDNSCIHFDIYKNNLFCKMDIPNIQNRPPVDVNICLRISFNGF